MWKQTLMVVGILLLLGCADEQQGEHYQAGCSEGSDSVPANQYISPAPAPANTAPTFVTQPSAGEVITGTSVLKITFNESVTGVTVGTNVVLKNNSGIAVPMSFVQSSGNTYIFDPTDMISGSYYLTIGENTPILDSDGAAAIPRAIEFKVDDARTTAITALYGLDIDVLGPAYNAAAAVTNNLLSVIPAAMNAGIAASDSSGIIVVNGTYISWKNFVISSLLNTVNGAASLTSTADRTITRINDTANFTTLLGLISDLLVAQAVAGNLTASELGSAVTTVNDSLASAGADSSQVASFQSTFNAAITTAVAAEASLDASYITAVAPITVAGETLLLTSAVDTLSGTSSTDLFTGVLSSSTPTLNAADILSGGAGIDTLSITIADGPGTLSGFTMTDVETIQVTNYTNQNYTIDLANTSGVTNIILQGTGSVSFTNTPSGVITQNLGTGDLQITYRSTAFYLSNETDYSIQNVFVSASGDADWGSDKLVLPTLGASSIYIGEIDCDQSLDFRVDFFPATLGEHKKYNYYNSCSNASLTWTITSISQSSFSTN